MSDYPPNATPVPPAPVSRGLQVYVDDQGNVWGRDTATGIGYLLSSAEGGGVGPAGPPGPQGPSGADGAQGPPGPVVPATATVLGGVKAGSGVTIAADGTLTVP